MVTVHYRRRGICSTCRAASCIGARRAASRHGDVLAELGGRRLQGHRGAPRRRRHVSCCAGGAHRLAIATTPLAPAGEAEAARAAAHRADAGQDRWP